MELCTFCQKIKEIRTNQARPYYKDLCQECKEKEVIEIYLNMRKRISHKEKAL